MAPSPLQTKDGKSEEAHPAAFRSVLAWQVQPSQVQTFANTASQPPPHPAWGGGGGHSLSIVMLGSSRRENLGCLFLSKEPLILEELYVPDFDLPQIRSLHTPKRPFYISEAQSWLSLLLTCGAAPPSNPTVAHPPSKMGPWAACPGQKP